MPYVIDNPWYEWNIQTAAATASQYQLNFVWNNWTTNTATTVAVDPWYGWVNNTITLGNNTYRGQTPVHRELSTPEELAEARERRREAERVHVAARERAEALLQDHLTKAQRAEMKKHHRITVVGSRGRRYCIHTRGSAAGNVEVKQAVGNGTAAFLCAHPSGVPLADAFLAQKLHIEADEESFLQVANIASGSRALIPAA